MKAVVNLAHTPEALCMGTLTLSGTGRKSLLDGCTRSERFRSSCWLDYDVVGDVILDSSFAFGSHDSLLPELIVDKEL